MEEKLTDKTAFIKYARIALIYNIVVIAWGVFLRASHSGDGCGQFWLTCRGEVIPSAPELKTLIEFSHRLTTTLAGIVVVILVIWAFRRFSKGSLVRKAAVWSLIFIIIEGLIGGGLVLTGNTAGSWTPSRPFWSMGHLMNTFMLIAALTLTAWFAAHEGKFIYKRPKSSTGLIALGVLGIFFVGITGSLAALSSMIFPSANLSEGLAGDFSAASPLLVRLRLSHPILSILTAVYLIFLAGWLKSKSESKSPVSRWANYTSILLLIQLVWGAVTLLTLSPILMQLVHLLLADLIWISFILMAVNSQAEAD